MTGGALCLSFEHRLAARGSGRIEAAAGGGGGGGIIAVAAGGEHQ
jgi:hypothetical protein